jgi:cation diffusion facilitator family transporter
MLVDMSHVHHAHSHPHAHPHPRARRRSRIWHVLRPHSHDRGTDAALEASADGWRTLWISLAGLAVTAAAQAVVVALSGSVALLGDTLHNAADALTAVPLGVAFMLGRRRPSRRYTYGYGRAEDLAGIAIVVVIVASCAVAAFAAVQRLAHPHPVTHLTAVAAAAALGFAGNELVAHYRIATGRRIGSAALIADGRHARTDGLTSLAVLVGAGGVAIGWTWADPVVGLAITAAILAVGWQAARDVGRRLMDSVDPALTETAEATLRATPGVLDAGPVRLRWVGRTLRAECTIGVDPHCSVIEAHEVAVSAEHRLIHAIPALGAVTVHADPLDDADHHAALADHVLAVLAMGDESLTSRPGLCWPRGNDRQVAPLDQGQDPGQQTPHPAGRGAARLHHLGVAEAVPGQACG